MRWGRRAYGQGHRCAGAISWRQILDEEAELKRLYTGPHVPGKPKVHKKCGHWLEVSLAKFEEAFGYRERGACDLAAEYALDGVRYHGLFMECQLSQERTAKKKKKKSKRRKG